MTQHRESSRPDPAPAPERPPRPQPDDRDDRGDASDPDQPIPPDPGKTTDIEIDEEGASPPRRR